MRLAVLLDKMDCGVMRAIVAVVVVDAGKVVLLKGRLHYKLRDGHEQRPHHKDGHVHVEQPPEQDKVGGHCSAKVTLHLLDVGPPELKRDNLLEEQVSTTPCIMSDPENEWYDGNTCLHFNGTHLRFSLYLSLSGLLDSVSRGTNSHSVVSLGGEPVDFNSSVEAKLEFTSSSIGEYTHRQ